MLLISNRGDRPQNWPGKLTSKRTTTLCHRVGSVAGMTTNEAQRNKNRRAPPSAPSRALHGVVASTASSPPRRLPLARAADEFVLTTVLLFLAVTGVRWLRDPGSTLCIADLDVALAVIGVLTGAIVTALIVTPSGRRSGGHMNPAVTVALWRMDVFPGRSVLPYVLAQLAGSAAGTALGRLTWGRAVSLRPVDYAAITPAPTWQPTAVFLAETGSMFALILIVGFILAHPSYARLLPYAIGLSVGLVIAVLGPLSGGSINPARQFGPAAFSGQTTDLWIYLVAPILGAVLGAWVHHLLIRAVPHVRAASRRRGHSQARSRLPVTGEPPTIRCGPAGSRYGERWSDPSTGGRRRATPPPSWRRGSTRPAARPRRATAGGCSPAATTRHATRRARSVHA
jgi:glycerol uptake facilitator-like aquaporin